MTCSMHSRQPADSVSIILCVLFVKLSQFVTYETKANDVLYDFEMIKVPLAATLIFRKSTLHMTVTKKQYRISKEPL